MASTVGRLIFLLGVALLLCGAMESNAQPITQKPITWKLATGETLRYEIVQSTDLVVNAGEAGAFTTHAEQRLSVAWRIESVADDGSAKILQQIERLRITIAMPDGLQMEYDSLSEDPPTGVASMLSTLYSALLEAEIPLSLATNGQLLSFAPSEKTLKRLAGVPAARGMGHLVTETGLKQIAESIAFTSTPKPLLFSNRVLGKVEGELQWKAEISEEALNENEKRFVPLLSLTLTPAPPVAEDAPPQPAPIVSPQLKNQTVEGEAWFDAQAGHLLRSKLHWELEITGEVTGNPITSQLKQTIQVKQVR